MQKAPGASVVYVLLWTYYLCGRRPWLSSLSDFNAVEFPASAACDDGVGETCCGTIVMMEVQWSLPPIVHVLAKSDRSTHSTMLSSSYLCQFMFFILMSIYVFIFRSIYFYVSLCFWALSCLLFLCQFMFFCVDAIGFYL